MAQFFLYAYTALLSTAQWVTPVSLQAVNFSQTALQGMQNGLHPYRFPAPCEQHGFGH